MRYLFSVGLATTLEFVFSSYSTHTDGLIYSEVCRSLSSTVPAEAYPIFMDGSAGLEPVSMGLLYLICYFGFDFSVVNIALNSLFIYLALRLYCGSILREVLVIIFLLTNFYFVLLLFGLYKLKVAAIFLVLAFLSNAYSNSNVKRIVVGLSVFSHLQILPIFLSNYTSRFWTDRSVRIKLIFIFSFLSLFIIIFFPILKSVGDYFIFRADAYKESGVFSWKLLLLYFAHVLAFGFALDIFILFFILILLASQIGDGRLIILYFLYLLTYLSIKVKGSLNGRSILFLGFLWVFSFWKAIPLIHSLVYGYSYFLDLD